MLPRVYPGQVRVKGEKMKKKAKGQGFVKMVILVAFLIVGGYGLSQNLFFKVMVAHADDSKPKIQELRTQPTTQGWIKIYLGAAPIKVTFENSRWIANRTEIRNWITTTIGTTSVNPSSFVNSIANQVNIPATGDHDGRSVDTNNLTNQINEALTQGLPNRTIALVTSVIPHGANAQAGRFPGRYIDINLSEQTLSAFEGYNLINQFLVSTGRRGYATPTGEFHVYGKDRSARMHGPGYYLPNVPYISWWSGDYSIHGTYWHHNFGHPMSHGCINASISDAEWIYNWDDIGTPVYVHY